MNAIILICLAHTVVCSSRIVIPVDNCTSNAAMGMMGQVVLAQTGLLGTRWRANVRCGKDMK